MARDGLPLEGVKVIEYANFVAAPSCGRLLAEWGAEVIKIEPKEGDVMRHVGFQWNFPTDEDENAFYEIENAAKKSIVVDTRTKEGVEAIYKLLESADVFLTNTRQKALDKSGLNYDEVKKRCPHIIYAHLLGYGEKGPAKDNPAFDYTAYFSRGSVSMALMEKGTAPCVPMAGLGDHYAGSTLAGGVLAALLKQRQTGKGERVTVSLFHTAIYGMGIPVCAAQYGYEAPISRKNPPNPLNTTFQCSDDKWIQLAFFQYDKWFPGFCNIVIERPDLIGGKYSTMKSAVNYVEEFVELLEKEFAKRPIEEWCERLTEAGIPHEKLATPADVLEDEQAWANDYLIKHTYRNGNQGIVFNTPVMFTENKVEEYIGAPALAEHTAEQLKGVGYTDEDLKELQEKGVIKY